MAMTVQCPNPSCGHIMQGISDRHLGGTARCPRCGVRFSIYPSMNGAAPSPAPGPLSSILDVETVAPEEGSKPPASHIGEAETTSPQAAPGLPTQIGRFRVRGRLGRGGFGVVYRAYDPQLEREVALKVPHAGTLDTPAAVQRFLREARTAARLHHPQIVPVYDAGQDGPHYYIASAFIAGVVLSREIGDQGLDPHRAARIVCDLAGALAYAHGQGIVHRDVKPDNVMVDQKGDVYLVDFGLAYWHEAEERLTHTGANPGTPGYMAPEQVGGSSRDAKPASDQYSLGVVLFQLLCGRMPFEGIAEYIRYQTANSEPPPPRTLHPEIPLDLETICLKAIAKQPEARYASCEELAEDLRRWLKGQPIRARRLSPAERLVRWCRRNPMVAGLVVSVALMLVACTVISTSFALYALAENRRAHAEKLVSDRRLYDALMNLAQRACEEDRLGYVLDLLESQQPEQTGGMDLRGWEWYFLYRYCRINQPSPLLGLHPNDQEYAPDARKPLSLKNSGSVMCLAFGPDGMRLASGSSDGTVRIHEVATGKEARTFATAVCVKGADFSPDGTCLAWGSTDGTVKIHDVTTGRELINVKAHESEVNGVAFSPDCKRLASCSNDGMVIIRDIATGHDLLRVTGAVRNGAKICSVAFSPDGKRLAFGRDDGMVMIQDTATGQVLLALVDAAAAQKVSGIYSATFPDGSWKIWGDTGGSVIGAKGSNPKLRVTVNPDGTRTVKYTSIGGSGAMVFDGLRGGMSSGLTFNPDGTRLAMGGAYGTIYVWDLRTGGPPRIFKGHYQWVTSVAFNPGGTRLVSGSLDGMAKVWDTTTGQEVLTFRPRSEFYHKYEVMFLSPVDPVFGIESRGRWEVNGGAKSGPMVNQDFVVNCVAFSPDGKCLASGGSDGVVNIWDGSPSSSVMALPSYNDQPRRAIPAQPAINLAPGYETKVP